MKLCELACVMVASLAQGACGTAAPSRAPAERAIVTETDTSRMAPTWPRESAADNSDESREPVLLITDTPSLRYLEAHGADIGSLAFDGPAQNLFEVAKRESYTSVVRTIVADLAASRRRDPALGIGLRFAHRQFNPVWLTSPEFRFELVGVVNRLDRRSFDPDYCGELRFVYRLAYTHTEAGRVQASRLPMTVNVVFFQPKAKSNNCSTEARAWYKPSSNTLPLGEWLLAVGPLRAGGVARLVPKSVEINLQSQRWPATVRPSLGGHASYLLRVFERSQSGLAYRAAALENTLDSARLGKDPQAKAGLLAWLRKPESLAEIELGIAKIPNELAALQAESVTPHGLARETNRTFLQSLLPRSARPEALRVLENATAASPSSAEMLLRKLDGLSCSGCHQSGSVAGFHLLGEDPERSRDGLFLPASPHLYADLPRRAQYLAAVAKGEAPEEFRPSAELQSHRGVGAPCGITAAFASWTCEASLLCVAVADADVGRCMPAQPGVGDACEYGRITRADGAHDRASQLNLHPCSNGRVCERNQVGFPLGMCAGSCAGLEASEGCGRIAILQGFNDCLAQKRSFSDCAAENTRPGALKRCSAIAPCRDDYVCARSDEGGLCIPPYFLLQLRVDGHNL